ncbi:S8 family serine peptidase [Deinococcus rubellus]|uniref:S8 family serine peptidase n=1 Tax=Deinococcus rubellus TaxID=1889240 RepID=A0ABY5YHF1_9DEIO|nr:S8 family serine peptidase [Deinococcus rubellus]UWX64489.1 S8 family serine peptidase [Deinococcus rubellus]
MKRFPRSALLSAGLLLSACSITPTPGGVYTVSGNVLVPGAGSAEGGGLATLAVSAPADWSASHVRGQVLLSGLNEAGLSAQTLTALSDVRTQRLPSAGLTVAYTPAGQSDAAFAARLTASGLMAQPNYRYQALDVPNDPGFPGNAGIQIGGAAYDQDYLTRINAQAAWDELAALGRTPLGARVAVLDTGVNASHEDLVGRVLPGRDFCAALVNGDCVGEDADPSDLTTGSEAGHGTSSAGLIGAATNNGEGLAGLTWSGQNILPVKVFGASGAVSGATTVSLTAGLKYAVAQSAQIINLSLGFAGSNAGPNGDPALSAALAAAAAANVLVVAAAGNTPGDGLYYPASDPNVLAVGALGRSDALACYSARPVSGQKALDLVAPGGNAGSGTSDCYQTSPDDLLLLTSAPGPGSSGTGNSLYRLDAGTSFAAPQVSGAASLIRALRPDLTADQVKSILIGSARTVTGGRLLDVGAAITAASAFGSGTGGGTVVVPPPDPNPLTSYRLTVNAFQGTVMVSKFSSSGKMQAATQRLPYRLNNLSAGTYTLDASLTVNGVVSQGQVQVTVGGDTQQDISTQ